MIHLINQCRPILLAVVLIAAVGLSSPLPAQVPEADSTISESPDPFESTTDESATNEDDFQSPAEEVVTSDETNLSPSGLFLRKPLVAFFSILPFVIASLIAIWFSAERLVVLRKGRVIPKPFVSRFLLMLRSGTLDRGAAIVFCEENDSPVANIFVHGVRKWGRPSVEVEQAIIDGGERQVSHLRKHLRIINGVATITPLIGLLGTVVGMMMAFFNLAGSDGGNRAEHLAVGIVTALGTTALGLAIAIPCLIIYMYLVGRIDALVMEMDDLAQQVVNRISAEGLAANPPVRPGARTRTRPAERRPKRRVET